jgi:anionic cell wall polymer biosynthesis LytR-Cps2A-Psr (LCP) family protein
MELLMYDPTTRRGGVFHIPANLGTQIVERDRFDTISVLYEPGEPSALVERLEIILGTNVPFVAEMSLGDVAGIVDLLGGLELFVSNPIDQQSADGRVLLPSGSVVLDGEKILQYLVYQEPLEQEMDFVARKQKFLQALIKTIGQPETAELLASPQARDLFLDLCRTNISEQGFQTLIQELGSVETDRLIFQRVIGNLREVDGVDGPVLFPHYEGVLIQETIAQMEEAIRSGESEIEDSLSATLEILNGTSIDGLARRTKALYESFGMDVISIGNADNDQYLNTVVLDRRGKPSAAQRVAEIIRCDRIHSRSEPSTDADVTIILGRDFDGRYIKR